MSVLTLTTILGAIIGYVTGIQIAADGLLDSTQSGVSCKVWCEPHAQKDWTLKCRWKRCGACAPCGGKKAAQFDSHTVEVKPHHKKQAGHAQKHEHSDALSRTRSTRADMTRACAGWCSTHGSDWSNKCGWPDCNTCSDCSALANATGEDPMGTDPMEDDTSGDTSAGDSETEEETTGGTAACPKYCTQHENPWSVKCDWEDCMACSPCPVDKVEPTKRPTPVPTPKPTRQPTPEAVVKKCPTWCERHASEWAVKCDYEDCMPCEPCPVDKNVTASPTPQPTHGPTVEPTPEAEVKPCPKWCERNANPWTSKCAYEECSVCSPCPIDTEESTSPPTQPPTVQPSAPPTKRPTNPPAQPATPAPATTDPPTAEEPSSVQECPRWCERNANPWTTKCTYEECSVCTPCPIDEEEEEPSSPTPPPPTAPQPAPAPANEPPAPQPTDAPIPPPSPLHTSQPTVPVNAPPSSSTTGAPAQLSTDAPSHPPTHPPGEETNAQKCPNWCQRHTTHWSVKCAYEQCSVCEQCPTTLGLSTTEEPALGMTTTAVPKLPTPTAEPDGTTEKVQNSDTPNATKVQSGTTEKGTTEKGTVEKVQNATTGTVEKGSDGEDGNATDGKSDKELVCKPLCILHKKHDWDEKCLWESCFGCGQCKEKVHPCMTSADCRQEQGQYCADPRQATVEVDTCARVRSVLGLCLCVEVFPGKPNIVRVGD